MYHPLDGARELSDSKDLVWRLCRMLNASWCGLHPDYSMRFVVEDEVAGSIKDICNHEPAFGTQAAKELLVNGFGWNPEYVASL